MHEPVGEGHSGVTRKGIKVHPPLRTASPPPTARPDGSCRRREAARRNQEILPGCRAVPACIAPRPQLDETAWLELPAGPPRVANALTAPCMTQTRRIRPRTGLGVPSQPPGWAREVESVDDSQDPTDPDVPPTYSSFPRRERTCESSHREQCLQNDHSVTFPDPDGGRVVQPGRCTFRPPELHTTLLMSSPEVHRCRSGPGGGTGCESPMAESDPTDPRPPRVSELWPSPRLSRCCCRHRPAV